MSLDFYIGKNMDSINFKSKCVEFDDELQNYLYYIRNKVSFDIQPLYGIDPYDDTIFDENDIKNIIATCVNLLDSKLLEGFGDEASVCILNIKRLCEEALQRRERLFSIGD
ncbi:MULTISPECIES: hypothetical protein [Bacillus]|uniref:Uncharacterized protein n=1 Tax=Bacillus wiedmannii TaxID=1890302 RepID=A0AB73S5E8_9BACI|nr:MULTISPECIES: hypothetical protein [Bacillus cereus group]EOP11368.1 hypothetical protein ICS_02609 [Bacillus cereus BAG2O-3]EOQ10676.1 hypothetical protein KQ3_02280 [Bacillus cereus B5-2]MDA1601511.1 hypothetical protein [Bacillus cereus]RFB43341.1 hypothetical protein DZB83_22505 [Bacillus sp. dmp10]OAK18320.1 hypothetical protein A6281_27365 [Bacillus wiedmannii]